MNLNLTENQKMNIDRLVETYLTYWGSINDKEAYKWDATKHFQDNFFRTDLLFSSRITGAIALSKNLLMSRNYYAGDILKEISNERSSQVESLLNMLFDEKIPLKERVVKFQNGIRSVMNDMAIQGYSNWKGRKNIQSFQDVRAISVYMAMRYPERYFFYKYTIFNIFAEIIGYTIHSKNCIDRYLEYLKFCELIREQLLKHKSLVSFYNEYLKEKKYKDREYTLLTQDFIYAIATHLNNKLYGKANKKVELARSETIVTMSSLPSCNINKSNNSFKGEKGVDYLKLDQLNHNRGLQGEFWVITYEKERLAKLGINYEVKHSSVLDGDGKGYDILSVEDDGKTPRYIEVKTTTGNIDTPFYFSANEKNFSKANKEHYYLYRVYNFKGAEKRADIALLQGSLEELSAEPICFQAKIAKINK